MSTEASAKPLATDYRGCWWYGRRDELLALAEEQAAAWVYDPATVLAAVRALTSLDAIDRVLFAMKSNFNAGVLRLLNDAGVDFECVSPMEVEHLERTVGELPRDRILFTPNFAPRTDYEWARDNRIRTTLDNLHPLRAWPEIFDGQSVFVRVDPGIGRGHHEHVVTSGTQSKFGIALDELDELENLVRRAGATVSGIHAHSGSGIPEADTWGSLAKVLAGVALRFPEAQVLDLGGGLGVHGTPGAAAFDLRAMNDALLEAKTAFPGYELWLEPGRFLVAESGVLLTRVTQLKRKGERHYVGVTAGMNALIRPALYGAWHDIVNLTRIDSPADTEVTVVGPICETGDTLGRDRTLPRCSEGDVILILNAGAYGRVMSSEYNLRPVPPEVLLGPGETQGS